VEILSARLMASKARVRAVGIAVSGRRDGYGGCSVLCGDRGLLGRRRRHRCASAGPGSGSAVAGASACSSGGTSSTKPCALTRVFGGAKNDRTW